VKNKASRNYATGFSSDPGEIRTLDPLIKSQLLYQLSYGVVEGANISKHDPIKKSANQLLRHLGKAWASGQASLKKPCPL
jgi:hypothetical protein